MYVKMEGNVGYEFKCTVYYLIVQQLMILWFTEWVSLDGARVGHFIQPPC